MAITTKPYFSHFSLYIITLTFLSLTPPSLSTDPTSVYDILPNYGLPSGLLPDCVTNYTLNSDTGDFSVDLSNTCYVQYDYLVYYEKRITGTLKIGSITNLDGIQVKRFFFWLDVDEIRVDLPPSNSIYFQVGFINKKLNIDQFQTVHSCQSTLSMSPRSWNSIFELPPPVGDEIPMLLTE